MKNKKSKKICIIVLITIIIEIIFFSVLILKKLNDNYKFIFNKGQIESILTITPLDSWEYSLDENDICLIKYTGGYKKIYIPDTFDVEGKKYNTKLTGNYDTENKKDIEGPFFENLILEEIKFGDNVKIDKDLEKAYGARGLFYSCFNLEKVYNFPANITNLHRNV